MGIRRVIAGGRAWSWPGPRVFIVANVKAGALLALVALAMIALGSAYALRADDREAADAGSA